MKSRLYAYVYGLFMASVMFLAGTFLTHTNKALASSCPGDIDYSSWTPDQKLNVFSPLPVSHGINLKSWTNPSGTILNLGKIDWGSDMSCNPAPGPASAPSTITILPTNYSITVNNLTKQSANGYGSYVWSYYSSNGVTSNPLPAFSGAYGKPVGNSEHYDFSAMCSGWQCNWLVLVIL